MFTIEESDSHKQLTEIASDLRAGKSVQPVTVRTLLRWFYAQRRGSFVVWRIRLALEEAGLSTEPDFAGAYIDAPITFVLAEPQQQDAAAIASETDVSEYADPTFRISRLAAANQAPVSVRPDSELREAVTKMLAGDYSQLPVMTNERDVKGVVTWASIGAKLALGLGCKHARDFMDVHHDVLAEASLFSAIALITKHGYVLVRGADNRITGIVTATDLSLQFQQLTEPFLLLGEIENHVRVLIARSFTQADLEAARDPKDSERSVGGVSDLTFGEYIRLLESAQGWEKLNLALDRKVFCERLQRVRLIRNDVMHFDPDGIIQADLDALRDFARFLQALQNYRG